MKRTDSRELSLASTDVCNRDLLRFELTFHTRKGPPYQTNDAVPVDYSILDAVKKGLELPTNTLAESRKVLTCFGNMTSATVIFVLQRMMHHARAGQRGCATSFGPGLTEETLRFHVV